jgi:hypothetical protein
MQAHIMAFLGLTGFAHYATGNESLYCLNVRPYKLSAISILRCMAHMCVHDFSSCGRMICMLACSAVARSML